MTVCMVKRSKQYHFRKTYLKMSLRLFLHFTAGQNNHVAEDLFLDLAFHAAWTKASHYIFEILFSPYEQISLGWQKQKN